MKRPNRRPSVAEPDKATSKMAKSRTSLVQLSSNKTAYDELGVRLATIFNDRLSDGLSSEEVMAEWEKQAPEIIVAHSRR